MENNKLIAEFMSYESYKFKGYVTYIFEDNNHRAEEDLHYHISWDWLMPVVRKISNLCEEPAELDNIKYGLLSADIDSVYGYVIELIKEYNENR